MRWRFFVSLIFFLSLSSLGLFAQNQNAENATKTMSLKEIDSLTNGEVGDYQKALVELNKYLEIHPEQFDSVQRRIEKIMKARSLYTFYAQELLKIIKEGQEGHNEELKSITDKMIALERNPGDVRLDVIKDMNYLVSMYQFSALQNKCAELIGQKKYLAAANKSCEGFSVLRDNFLAKYGKSDFVSMIDFHISSVTNLISQFEGIQARIKIAKNAYDSALLEDNDGRVLKALETVLSAFGDYAIVRNAIVDEAIFFENEFLKLQKVSENQNNDQEDLYLKHSDEYLSILCDSIVGWRKNPNPEHGILGAIDAFWNVNVEEMKQKTLSVINKNIDFFNKKNSVVQFEQNGSLLEKQELEKIKNYAICAQNLNESYLLRKNTHGQIGKENYSNFAISVDYVKKIAEQTEELVENVRTVANFKEQAEKILVSENIAESEMNGSDYSEKILFVAKNISSVIQNLKENTSKNSDWGKQYRTALEKQKNQKEKALSPSEGVFAKKTSGVEIENSVLEWSALEKTFDEYSVAISAYSKESISSVYSILSNYYSRCGVEYVQKSHSTASEISAYNNGGVQDEFFSANRTNSTASTGRKYPAKAMDSIKKLESYITSAKKVLETSLEKLSSPYSEFYLNDVLSINGSIKELSQISVSLKSEFTKAQKLMKDFDSNVRRAKNFVADSKKAFNEKKYDRALLLVERANNYYNEALKFNYDEDFSQKNTEEILSLMNEIKEKQKIIVSDEVDSMLLQANLEYKNDNYQKAQNILSGAQSRWNSVFSGIENHEITTLNTLVETALSMSNAREVLPGDPLYPEVSQILSVANEYFDKGKSLFSKGKIEDANNLLNLASAKLEELRTIVPQNKDANLLRLKIQQVQNPDEFNTRFAQRVETARQEYKQKDKQLSAYNDLSDLAQINPNYPGLNKLIEEIEYEIGKKVRPVDRSGIVQSENLTQEARKLFDAAGNNQQKLQQALSKVDQALVKNAENQNAKKLKRNILAKIQVRSTITTYELKEKYQEALEKYNNEQFNEANDIIQELWAYPENRTEQVEKLKKRVEARL